MTEYSEYHTPHPIPRIVPTPPKPGVVPLRPLGVGEILDGAIGYMRANPRVTLGLSAVVALIGQLLILATRLVDRPAPTPSPIPELAELERFVDVFSGGLLTQAASLVIGTAVSILLTGMLIPVLARAVLGRRSTLRDVWAAAGSRLPGLFVIWWLTLLGSMLAFFVVSLAGGLGIWGLVAAEAPVWVSVLVGALSVAVGGFAAVYLWVSWALAPAVYVLERRGMFAALGGSRRLVRGKFWRIFGILLLAWIIATIVSGILAGVPMLGAMAAIVGSPDAGGMAVALLAGMAVCTILSSAVVTPFSSGVVSLLYVDQRMRRDGLDIQLRQIAEIDGVGLHDAFAVREPSAPEPPAYSTGLPQAS